LHAVIFNKISILDAFFLEENEIHILLFISAPW